MDEEIDELELSYVISHHRSLMTEEEIEQLTATSYKNNAKYDARLREVVCESIYKRLMAEHRDKITIPRCECCGKVIQQSWKTRCARCKHAAATNNVTEAKD